MNKTIKSLTTAALMLSILACAATSQSVTLGIKGGFNSSETDIPLSSLIERGRTSGLHIGGLAALNLSERFRLQLEVLYSEKGFRGDRREVDLHYEVEAGYIQIPLVARLRFPRLFGALGTPHLFAGPELSFETSCNVGGRSGETYLFYLCDGPPVHFNDRKKLDVGMMFGVGVEVPAGAGAIQMDVAYDRGIRDLGNRDAFPRPVRNGTLMASVGYSITIGSAR